MCREQVYDALEVDDAACAIFEHMPDLEALDLTNQRLITAAGLSRLTALRKLQSLSVGLCPAMCEEGYQIIACLTQLTGLSLDHGCAKSGVMHGPGSPPKTGLSLSLAIRPLCTEADYASDLLYTQLFNLQSGWQRATSSTRILIAALSILSRA